MAGDRRRASAAASTASVLLGAALAFAAAGCQTPFLVFSGGALAGEVAETDSFAFAERYRLLQLEVRPEDPYSVILRVVVLDGSLYIDAAEQRRWHTFLQRDPNVRIKLGERVYAATAVRVDDADVTDRFRTGRTIYRLIPGCREEGPG